jgi:hypothetical protein
MSQPQTSNPKDMANANSRPRFNLVEKGKFYFIYENPENWILEDKTKRGLEVREKAQDKERNTWSEKGIIYDMDGIGHKVNIRVLYPKNAFTFEKVEQDAKIMEKKYLELREMTCPEDIE